MAKANKIRKLIQILDDAAQPVSAYEELHQSDQCEYCHQKRLTIKWLQSYVDDGFNTDAILYMMADKVGERLEQL